MKLSRLKESVFLRDAFSLSSGTAIAQIITFLALPILTRLYSPEDFGALALYVAISSMLAIFATLKIEQVIMLPDSDGRAFEAFLALVIISLLFSIIILLIIFLSFKYRLNFYEYQKDSEWLYFVPLSVFLFSCYQGLRFWLMRRKKFSLISISLISAISIGSLTSIFIGYFFKQSISGASGLIIGYLVEGIVRPIIMLINFFDYNKNNLLATSTKKIIESIVEYKKLILTLIVSHGISALYSRALIMTIEVQYGAAILGYYSMAQKIISAPPTLLSNALGDVFRQRASVSWRENGNFSKLLLKALLLSAAIGIPIYSIAILIAPDMFSLVLGEKWRYAGYYASIMLISGLFAFIVMPTDKGAIIVGAYRYIFFWHLIRLFLYIASIVFVIVGNYDFKSLLYIIVVVDSLLWIFDCFYEYRLSKG